MGTEDLRISSCDMHDTKKVGQTVENRPLGFSDQAVFVIFYFVKFDDRAFMYQKTDQVLMILKTLDDQRYL